MSYQLSSCSNLMQIFLLPKLTKKTLITKKFFKFASLGRPSASLAPLEIKKRDEFSRQNFESGNLINTVKTEQLYNKVFIILARKLLRWRLLLQILWYKLEKWLPDIINKLIRVIIWLITMIIDYLTINFNFWLQSWITILPEQNDRFF